MLLGMATGLIDFTARPEAQPAATRSTSVVNDPTSSRTAAESIDNSVNWLEGDWVINQSELGCASRMAIKYESESRIEVSMNGKVKGYDFTSDDNGGVVKTSIFTFRRNGNEVEVSGERTNFKLSQCVS